jgi:glycosyltransferase involved in cell wall biosynthesis
LLAIEVGRLFPGITVIAGQGPLAPAVAQSAKATQVRYLGYRANPVDLYRAADAFLFTSVGGEGYPTNTLLEAAAHGLPIIANLGSEAGQVVTAAGGCAPSDDPADIAECAAQLAATGHVPEARAWAERHDLNIWQRKHEALLLSLSS